MEQERENRRQRINRLKKAIVLLSTVAWMIPLVLCLVLFGVFFGNQNMLKHQNQVLEELLQTQKKLEERYDAIEERLASLEDRLLTVGEGAVEEVQTSGDSVISEGVTIEPSNQEREGKKRIYLTFDDGPSVYTGDILDVLKEYNVKATFFVNGKEGEWADEALKRIVDEGHTLGMHSYSHEYEQIYASVEDFAADYEMLHEHILYVTGYDSKVYRFPGGSSNHISKIDIREFGKYLADRGTTYYDWNISSKDASKVPLSVNAIVKNCTQDLDKLDDCMILCHDAKSKATTVEALPILIERIMEMEDVEFLPITENTPLIQHISLNEID